MNDESLQNIKPSNIQNTQSSTNPSPPSPMPNPTNSMRPSQQNIPQNINRPNISSPNALRVESMHVSRRVRGYLQQLIIEGGSDLHLKANACVRARINGDIVVINKDIFTREDSIEFAKELMRARYQDLLNSKELDMTYKYDANTRFRVNVFFQMEGISFAFRKIPLIASSTSDLGLPQAVEKIFSYERGLVLVTGITGSGKTTTLSALINEINNRYAKHIITIEDPIEFIHKDKKSIINQRSVGMDTNSFYAALKAALREDPDIILVGEMRDLETIEMALRAAETGHLVLSTLHTIDARETIKRIISVFNVADQQKVRTSLASVLSAVISQRLIKTRSGTRVPAVELLFKTSRIESIILESRDNEILDALAEGREVYGTQTFDQHLFELVVDGVVDESVALDKASSPSDLKLRLDNINYYKANGSQREISIKI